MRWATREDPEADVSDRPSSFQGMILVNGPGQAPVAVSPTLLTFSIPLKRNISTAEDPVEINLEAR